jgi:hypothetical protein
MLTKIFGYFGWLGQSHIPKPTDEINKIKSKLLIRNFGGSRG